MATDLVNSATSSKLAETDWSKNIAICELVARDHRQAKDVVKAIKKRVGNKHQHVQLYAVMLLEMLINNIGEPIHKQVVEGGILTSLVKIVKKKSDHPVRERIFLLLDAAQTSVGGASGRFPQYYSAYYELVSAGVKFPQRPRDIPRPRSTETRNNNNPVDNRNHVPEPEPKVSQAEEVAEPRQVLQNANSAMEVLRDVLDAIDTFFPEKAKDDITLEFVEQCSFAKQRVMHLALHTLDETVVTRAVEINEQLDRVLQRHYALLDVRVERSIRDAIEQQRKEEEREEAEQLFRRLQKGKACAEPEDENLNERNPFGFMGTIPGNILHRPLIRPLPTEPKQESLGAGKPAVVIPPPPVNHAERERFFRENRSSDSSGLSGHMRSLSLHSMTGSSSHSGSTDFSDRC